MKTILALLSLFPLLATAAPVRATICQAHCLGIDWQAHDVVSLGVIEGIAKTERQAFLNLNKSCQRKLERVGSYAQSYLANGDLDISHVITNTESGSSSYSSGYVATWEYVSAWESSGSSWTFTTESNMRVRLQLAKPVDSCRTETVDETELIPVYEGTQIIFG